MSITTQTKRAKKLHQKFKAKIMLDSSPIEIEIEADSTQRTITELTKNQEKFSFGKIITNQKASIEIYMYPNSNLNFANMSYSKDFFAKGNQIGLSKREIRELCNLGDKLQYFMALTTQRKVIYLRNHGYFAHINITYVKRQKPEDEMIA